MLELAENVWDYLEDGGPLPDLLRIRTSPRCLSDLKMMLQEGLRRWIRSHNISIPQTIDGSYEEILSLAEKVWDANKNDALADFSKSRKPDYVKTPETKMDLRQLTLEDLTQWIDSHDVSYARKRRDASIWLRASGMLSKTVL